MLNKEVLDLERSHNVSVVRGDILPYWQQVVSGMLSVYIVYTENRLLKKHFISFYCT